MIRGLTFIFQVIATFVLGWTERQGREEEKVKNDERFSFFHYLFFPANKIAPCGLSLSLSLSLPLSLSLFLFHTEERDEKSRKCTEWNELVQEHEKEIPKRNISAYEFSD